ncbi:MAG: Rpn family recombination-promoting nuclease/putative transposase, partial [Candidatus Cloacimonetes bacterium]|nr:Rpn family recombination-promoting nuclease/putative transposase [Candidatus Cloacimonadota bacterium]
PLKFHGIFKIRDLIEEQIFCDSLEIHVLELPKLRKNPLELDAINCWLLYLDNMEGEILEQIVKQEPLIKKAISIEEAFILAEEERYNYELREKGRADYFNALSLSLKEGKKQGIQEGIQQGIQNTKHEMARKMLEINMRLEDIVKVTGLTPEEIQNL